MRLLFIHLKEAKKDWDECKNEYENLIYIIKNMHKMDKESKAYKSGEFDDMFKESEIGRMAAEDVVAYSASRVKQRDMQAAITYAADQAAEAAAARASMESYEKGWEKGMEKGMRMKAQSMARDLKAMGLPIEEIVRISELSIDDIMQL